MVTKTGLVLDDVFQRHVTGDGHPERPERLERISAVLHDRGLIDRCTRIDPAAADESLIRRVHTAPYVDRLKTACSSGAAYIDTPDSGICEASYDIALLAAGSILAAVDGVMSGELVNAFCAVRPPGHHAEADLSMGFCLLANVAIAVHHLRERHAVRRVLILDWDVHHGNGTQHLLEDDPDATFISIHGDPSVVYPGSGLADERGKGLGEGATVNVPMPPGSGDAEYRDAFERHIRPVLESFDAEFVLVSAGFDAHRRDPLAPMTLETESFDWMTRIILDAADAHCNGRLVSLLEGGYDLHALSVSVATHLELLVDRSSRG